MWQFIQFLFDKYGFVLLLIGLICFLWFYIPKTNWWKRHNVADFAELDHHPACFDCNEGSESCYKDLTVCQAWRDLLMEHHKEKIDALQKKYQA